MGTVGDCYDAPMEYFWGSVKIELFNRQRWSSVVELTAALSDYLENFYNTERRHNSLNYFTPNEFGALHSDHPTQAVVQPMGFGPRGGGKGIRTPDPLHAMQVLYQLSYTPKAVHESYQF